MPGNTSRRKGHNFERDVARKLSAIFPTARRHLEYQDGENNGVDITNTGNLLVQCKKKKNYAPINSINEIKPNKGIPILITAGDRLEPMVVISMANFISILNDIGIVYDQKN